MSEPGTTDALLAGIAPAVSTGMAGVAMSTSVALVLENAAVTERDTQRIEEASLAVTLSLMVTTATKAVSGS